MSQRTAAGLVLVAATFGLTAEAPADDCVVCTMQQECELWDPHGFFPPGEYCTITYDGGDQWCQYYTPEEPDCDMDEQLSALQLTAAGTYVADISSDRNELGTKGCNGFVVGHEQTNAEVEPLVIAL